MSVLFVIPARGGSKGLPGKNMRWMDGQPLIAYSIQAATEAAEQISNSRVVVSTDSPEIAKIAQQFGAEVPFLRPQNLASDEASSIDVILHALGELENNNDPFTHVAMIEPTSPQRDAKDLLGAYNMLMQNPEAESVVGISKTESGHPLFLTNLKEGFLDPYINKSYKVYRRQEIDEVYFFEGSMYISKVSSVIKRKSFYHEKTLGYTMPKWKSFEVDDEVDFLLIERLIQAKKQGLIK